jgi:hypothetical protein
MEQTSQGKAAGRANEYTEGERKKRRRGQDDHVPSFPATCCAAAAGPRVFEGSVLISILLMHIRY